LVLFLFKNKGKKNCNFELLKSIYLKKLIYKIFFLKYLFRKIIIYDIKNILLYLENIFRKIIIIKNNYLQKHILSNNYV